MKKTFGHDGILLVINKDMITVTYY